MERRQFIKNTALSAGFMPLLKFENAFKTNDELEIHIFSKQLHFLSFKELGEKTAEIGFAGVDLTVRPDGHIEPKDAKEILPKAIAEIKAGGSNCSIITTAVESTKNTYDRQILETASKLGIDFYRSNWYKYVDGENMEDQLLKYQKEVKALSELNQKLGIVGCYQNHPGLGASLWEVKRILATAVPQYFGSQYDIRHAVAEGGLSWENSLRLIEPNIKTIVVKDFKWEKVNGKWEIVNTPIGEGMVDFKKYFGLLKKYKINVPVTLHLEYNLGGAEHGHRELTVDKEVVFTAMKKDLASIRKLWKES